VPYLDFKREPTTTMKAKPTFDFLMSKPQSKIDPSETYVNKSRISAAKEKETFDNDT